MIQGGADSRGAKGTLGKRMKEGTGLTLQSQGLPCLPPPTRIQIVFNVFLANILAHIPLINGHRLTGAPLFGKGWHLHFWQILGYIHLLGCLTVVTPVTPKN